MRIRRLDVDGFGHFAGCTLGPFDAPLTVLHGPNEAGKSTMLAFIRTMLFGWPPQKRADWYPPLRGGNHGGRLALLDDRGLAWTIARSESPKGALLEVSNSAGRVDHPHAACAALLGHATKSVYESVFAFSLDELQSAKTLEAGDVSGQIYSAGMGAAKLPNAIKEIEAEQAALFKPGGSKQPVASLLRRIQSIDAELRSASTDAGRYAQLAAECSSLRERVDDALRALKELDAERRQLERIRDAWPSFVALRSAGIRLASLPEYAAFPDDAVSRLERLEEARERARRELDRAVQAHATAHSATGLPAPDQSLLDLSGRIARLREERGSFSQLISQLPARIQERDAAAREFDDSLRMLGPDWDQACLVDFDASVQARGLVDDWKARLDDADRCAADAEREARMIADSLAESEASQHERHETFTRLARPPFDGLAIEQRRAAIQGARSRLDTWLRARQHYDDLRDNAVALAGESAPAPAAGTGPGNVVLAVSIGAGVLLAAVGLGLGGMAAIGGPVAGTALAAIALWWRFRLSGSVPAPTIHSSAADAAGRRAQTAGEAEGAARELLNDALAQLRVPEASPAALDALESQLRAAEALLHAWEQERKAVEAGEVELARIRLRFEKATGEANRTAAVRDAARAAWGAWLVERQLQQGLLPSTMDAIFERVETARTKGVALEKASHRVEGMQRLIEKYREEVLTIATPLGLPVPPANHDLLAFADGLVRLHEEAEEAARQLKAAQDAESSAAAILEGRRAEFADAAGAVMAFLNLGGTSDPEEFRRRARTCAERRSVLEELRVAREHLQQQAEPGRGTDEFLATLAETDIEAVRQDIEAIEQQRAQLAESHSSLLLERGRREKEMETLATDEHTSLLRAQRVELQQELRETAHQWAVATAALTVLQEAQAIFEREKQPGVIRHAATFFQRITDGRYQEVQAPLGKQQVMVRAPHGTWKVPDQLSRGTQEQLYLALRFGLIRQFNDQETTLPVIVDDILVNFDPDRAARTAHAFGDLSQSNQVLVFTCHPHIRDLFVQAVPGTRVIELSG